MSGVLAYVAMALVAMWGVAHAIPTRRVIDGFGQISLDNRRVILQEWLAEAFTMWGLAAVILAATLTGGTAWVYRAVAGVLIGLAVLTALTGARTAVIWFKVCPVLLGVSATMLLVASFAGS